MTDLDLMAFLYPIVHNKDYKMLKNDLKVLFFVRYFVRYIFRYKYILSVLILNKLRSTQTTNTIKVQLSY